MSEKIISLMSPGIDSPVAAHLLSEVGFEVRALFLASNDNHGSEGEEKMRDMMDVLRDKHPDLELFQAPFYKIQEGIAEEVENRSNTCILCKRGMYMAAEKLAQEMDAHAISTGESLGQVASQTLSNLHTISQVVSLPIHRPLIGLDKDEVVAIAKEIGTFDISIRSSVPCPFTPTGPAVRSDVERIKKEEERVELKERMDYITFSRIEP